MGKGRCFELAVEEILDCNDDDGVVICHGLPIGTGPENGGKRYWHAWIEEGGVVYDPSADMEVSQGAYYLVGRIERVWKFKPSEAREMLREYGHYGPWVEGWEAMRGDLSS